MALKTLFITLFMVVIIFTDEQVALGEPEIGGGWQLEQDHITTGGALRVSDDGPKSDLIPDPKLEVGTDSPLDIVHVFTHPNYKYLSPLTECGYSLVEVTDYDIDDEDSNSPKNATSRSVEDDSQEGEEKRLKRIVGGKPVVGQKHPWMAQIYLLNSKSLTLF